MSKTINGIVTWLRSWFYTKPEVDSLFTNMIEIHIWSIPAFSLASGKGVSKTVTVPNPDGYLRIPLIQGAYKCYASSLGLNGTTLTVNIQNHYTTNANASMYGIILYIKSSINTEI